MKSIRIAVLCLIAFATQLSFAANEHVSETTLLAGYATGGSFDDDVALKSVDVDSGPAFGLVFDWRSNEPDAFYEVAYQRQDSSLGGSAPFDISIHYLQVGGHITFPQRTPRILPYFLITVGAARYEPDAPDLDGITRFAGALGGGIKFPITSAFDIRLDGRAYITVLNDNSDLFCRSNSGCSVHLRGDTLIQGIVSLGFTLKL